MWKITVRMEQLWHYSKQTDEKKPVPTITQIPGKLKPGDGTPWPGRRTRDQSSWMTLPTEFVMP